MRLSRLAIALALVVLVSACGSSSNNDSTPATQPSKPASTAGDAITIDNFKFTPGTLNIKRGAKVTVTNRDSTTHTATADDGAFDTGDLDPGTSKTVTLSKAGSYPYHCSIHTFMTATIVVS